MNTRTNKEKHPNRGAFSLFCRRERTRTHLNAARMSAAGEGWTEPNHNFCPKGQKCKSSPVTGTISSVHNVFELWTLDFSLQRIFVDVSEQVLKPTLFCFRQILWRILLPRPCGYLRCMPVRFGDNPGCRLTGSVSPPVGCGFCLCLPSRTQ